MYELLMGVTDRFPKKREDMDIHDKYNEMMADAERVKQIRADLNTYPMVSDNGNGKIVLDLSKNKHQQAVWDYVLGKYS